MDELYWTATTIAGLIVALVIADYVSSASNEPIIPVIPLLLAGIIWVVGQFCHRIAAEIHSS
jgi:glucose uptake protein GlcU